MTSNEAIAVLRQHESDLRARGVHRAAVFGSVASGDAGPRSDLDILIELDPEAALDVYGYVGLKSYIAGLFEGEVDVVNRGALKPHLRTPSERDAIYGF
jgi:predicted nucleotidyltransferase